MAGREDNTREKKQFFLLFLAWAAAVLATAGSLYLSEVMHFQPCSLCWFQRIFMYPLALLLGIAYARSDTGIAAYALPLAAIGGGFSLYHTVLQKLPHDSALAACGPVSCQGDYLNWFGFITIPMLALAAFAIIGASLLRLRKLDK
ncbi:disulfide oxidoreductase [Paenibacillus arenilitoris]|uniref:Disulfide bond formation protein B n=1 Tax=Paenibacillus arenilitoris TaxID=2772299 RepID=A0A927CPK0_9BACL|nr:disulfide oxidoreductase [Paenibacillus arenilitoris]MBD2869365.1 disulfide bond formation protein B [Paenibacillus arenilitoris]